MCELTILIPFSKPWLCQSALDFTRSNQSSSFSYQNDRNINTGHFREIINFLNNQSFLKVDYTCCFIKDAALKIRVQILSLVLFCFMAYQPF